MENDDRVLILVKVPFEDLETLNSFFEKIKRWGVYFLEKDEVKKTVTYKVPPRST